MSDVNNTIGSLKEEINGAFKDGVLDEVELNNLSNKLLELEKEKKEVDSIYEEIYNNPNLI